jgi:uncharacterized protein YdcH (DUF465 family)
LTNPSSIYYLLKINCNFNSLQKVGSISCPRKNDGGKGEFRIPPGVLGNQDSQLMVTRGAEMGMKEEELIERLMKEDEEFLKAKQNHAQFAKQLEGLESKPYLTPQDEMEIKILKKKKLAAKDQMEKILMKYR